MRADSAAIIDMLSDVKFILGTFIHYLVRHQCPTLFPNSRVVVASRLVVIRMLSKDPFILRKPVVGFQGTAISNFMLFEWYSRISQEEKQ